MILGVPPEYLVGKHVWTVQPTAAGQPIYHAFHRAAAEQISIHDEHYLEAANGWYEHDIYPVQGGIAVFVRDITARKRGEART